MENRKLSLRRDMFRNSRHIILVGIILLLTCQQNFAGNKTKILGDSIRIRIKYKEAKINDTLTLVNDEILHIASAQYGLARYDAVQKNGFFSFVIPVNDSCGYFDLVKSRTFTRHVGSNEYTLMSSWFWEKGDDIQINLSNKETGSGIYSICSFKGKGSMKYELRELTDSLRNSAVAKIHKPVFDSTYKYYDVYLDRYQGAIDTLKKLKPQISNLSYEVLMSNILYGYPKERFVSILDFYSKNVSNQPAEERSEFLSQYQKQFSNDNYYGISKSSLANSRSYLAYGFYKSQAASKLYTGKIDQQFCFNYIKNNFGGAIRDKIFLMLFLNSPKSSSLEKLYIEANKIIQDSISKNILNELIKSAPGKQFFNFTLQDTSGRLVRLSDFKDKIVLIDFWFNGCGGCAKLYQNTLSKIEKIFHRNSSVVVISINGDLSKKRWIDGINSGLYTSKEVINLYTNGYGMKHPLVKSTNTSMFPFVVLLSKNGIIRYFNSDNLYNYDELDDAINTLID
jgi:peroxiredoxin